MPMTLREMNLRVFRGEPLPGVFFQPRMEPWYDWQQHYGTLPPELQNLSVRDLYESMGLSMRYMQYYTGIPEPFDWKLVGPAAKREHTLSPTQKLIIYDTPHGELVEEATYTQDGTWRITRHAVKTVDDLRRLRWLYRHTTQTFSREKFDRGDAFIGDLAAPQFWLPKSPYQALAQVWMRYEDFIYAQADHPQEIAETLRVIDESYDPMYEQITAYGERVQIINFGENLHAHMFTPRQFEQHLLPYYEKRVSQLRAAGIFTHIHIDGSFKPMLPYLKDLPFDGLEALTPLPQGDVSIEELKEHIGDKILLDGIPAVLFMPTYSREDLLAAVEQIVRLFHPRLVLGVSDEVPQGAGMEGLERVRLVAEWCKERTSTR